MADKPKEPDYGSTQPKKVTIPGVGGDRPVPATEGVPGGEHTTVQQPGGNFEADKGPDGNVTPKP